MKISIKPLRIIASVIFTSFLFSAPAFADPLPVLRDVMSLDPDVTYTVSGDQYVYSTAVVTIPAGTKLVFALGARLVVYGKLIVKGTSKSHVTMSGEDITPLTLERTAAPEQVPEKPAEEKTVELEPGTIQSPEVLPLEIAAPSIEAPLEPVPLDAPETVSVMSAEIAAPIQKYQGIVFMNGSPEATLSYLDISNAAQGIYVDINAVVTASHLTFTDCNTGISNSQGTMKLTDSTFIDTAFPGQIATYATFTHTNTTFLGTSFKGWNYGGYAVKDSDIHLNSKDGAYYAFGLEVLQDGTLTFGPGTTVFIQDGFGIKVNERGALNINGTELSPVTVYGNGSCSLHMATLHFSMTSSGTIRHTNFHDLCGGIVAANAAIKITDSIFKKVTGTALAVSNQSVLTLTGNDISGSTIALSISGSTIKNVSQNYFHDNTVGVSVTDMGKAIIKNNGWGSDSGPKISSNPGGGGDSIVVKNVPDVVYRPWLGMKDTTIPTEPTEPENPPATTGLNPVIIVPGITGSVLTKDYGDKSELWPNLTKLTLNIADSHLDDLELLQSGSPSSVRPIVVGDIIRKISSVDVFDSLIATLSKNGYIEGTNLFVLPYDWRLSNAANQLLLKDAIAKALEKTGTSKVNIIAHSMGGLLVSSYIAQNPAAPIDHVFNIAVPHLGAPKTFKTLMYGDDMGFGFSIGSVARIPILNESRVKAITQNMPAVYELLPSKKYVDLLGSYVNDRSQAAPSLGLDATSRLMAADGRNEKMFPFALALHDKTDNVDVSKIKAYDFVGCGATKTISKFILTKEQSLTLSGFKLVPEHRLQYGAGDGVVPLNSANAGNGALNYYVAAGSHGTMSSVAEIQQAIVSALRDKPILTNAVLSDTISHCTLSGDIVEVHSPVSLDVYDGQGRHTGPTDTGEIEYGIPNVQYDVINDEKSVFLPSGSMYKIINRAESVGAFDMYVSHSDGSDAVTHQSYYHAVPLLSEKSAGTFMISSQSIDPDILFDDNGDGSADRTVAVSSSLEGSKAVDDTAPVTKAAFSEELVTLTATDMNAGVLNTKYSTDNIAWKSYDEPFKASIGMTIYYLSLDNAGNTEEIQEMKITAPLVKSSALSGSSTASAPSTPNLLNAVQAVSSASDTEDETDEEAAQEDTDTAETVDTISDAEQDKAKASYLVAPADNEGTVMKDNEITLKGLSASAGAAGAIGSTTVMIIGALALAGIILYAIFSKKRS
jgi:pimeloyl-ACP methyl ester carboxylesterase